MTAPRAITGQLVDAKNIAVHKAMRLSIDVPAELGAEIVKLFGWPTMAQPVPVAVARLAEPGQIEAKAEPAANSNGREHGPWASLTPTLQSVLRCQTPAFWTLLREEGESNCSSEDAAATYVRAICGVNSRSSLTGKAGQKWLALDSRYQAWLAGAGL